jgi:2'-5' RNA ligase
VRTFVAIDLNEESRCAVARVLETLRRSVGGVGWVRPENMHLTVKFLGEIDERDVPDATEAMCEAASGVEPFRMRCTEVSGFPPRGPLRVIHIAVEEPTGALAELARRLDEEMAEALGIKREKRPFTAHITLGRVRRRRECPPLPEIALIAGEPEPVGMRVDTVVLMRSELASSGSVYTALAQAPLGS